MKTLKSFTILVLLAAIVSCSPVKVVTDMDKSVDFSVYKTYSFLGWQDESDKLINDFDKKRVRDAFDGTSKDQIWQGIATATIVEDPAKREKSIPTKISALYKPS